MKAAKSLTWVDHDCTWDSLATDVVWDYQLKTWDDDGIWYVWGPDAALQDGWMPDLELVPC